MTKITIEARIITQKIIPKWLFLPVIIYGYYKDDYVDIILLASSKKVLCINESSAADYECCF